MLGAGEIDISDKELEPELGIKGRPEDSDVARVRIIGGGIENRIPDPASDKDMDMSDRDSAPGDDLPSLGAAS